MLAGNGDNNDYKRGIKRELDTEERTVDDKFITTDNGELKNNVELNTYNMDYKDKVKCDDGVNNNSVDENNEDGDNNDYKRGIKRELDTEERTVDDKFITNDNGELKNNVELNTYNMDYKDKVKCDDGVNNNSVDENNEANCNPNSKMVFHESKSPHYINYNLPAYWPELNNKIFNCIHCRDVYVGKLRIMDHLGNVHNDFHYFCDDCGNYFANQYKYTSHVKGYLHNCEYCSYGTYHLRRMRAHNQRIHKQPYRKAVLNSNA